MSAYLDSNSNQAARLVSSGKTIGGAAGGSATYGEAMAQTRSVTLSDRLSNLLDTARKTSGTLACARERLVGGWPENEAAKQAGAQGQIEGLLDALADAITTASVHASIIDSRI